MVWLGNALVFAGVLGITVAAYAPRRSRRSRRSRRNSGDFVQCLREDRLLSEWERRVLLSLKRQVRVGYHICPQVRLADMVQVSAPSRKAHILALNGVQRKSVDFILVSEESGQAVLGIELDDKTHDRPDRRLRDLYVNSVFRQIGVPLLRVRPGQRIELPDALRRMA